MLNKPIKFKTYSEWLEYRGNSIGGSNIATILGINPWQSKYELWLQLTGREDPPVENNNMIMGRFLEDGVAKAFEYLSGHHVVRASEAPIIMQHPKYQFLKASPDRKVFLGGSRKHNDTAILEVKTTGQPIDPDDVPLYWFVQPTYYAGFWGYKKIIVCWYDRHRNSVDWREYEFDKELFDMIIKQAVNFWNEYVIKDIPPEAETASDVLKMYQPEPGKYIIADDAVLDLYSDAIETYREKNKLAKEYKKIQEQVILIMKDAEEIVTSEGLRLFTFKANKNGKRSLRIKEM